MHVATKASNYSGTSGFVKGLVSGLTSIVNAVVPPVTQDVEETGERLALTPEEVYSGIISFKSQDFRNNR